jgi:hypothetical protein
MKSALALPRLSGSESATAADVGRRREGAAHPPLQFTVELDALVQKLLDRLGHRPVMGRGPEEKAIVAGEIVHRRLLHLFQVDLEPFAAEDLGDPDGHLLRVMGDRIIANERLGHEHPS